MLLLILVGGGAVVAGAFVASSRRSLGPAAPAPLAAILAVIVASGIGGALAPGAATGHAAFDLVLRAVLCAGLTALVAGLDGRGSVLSWWWLLAVALFTALVASGSPAQWLACGVSGLTLAMAATWTGGPLTQAVCVASLIQVALRLRWPAHVLMPSAFAAVIVLAMLIPAAISVSERAGKLVRWGLAIAGGVTLVLIAVAAASLALARSPLTTGLASAKAGIHAAAQGQDQLALEEFDRAQQLFSQASSDLAWSVPAEVVPVLSQQIACARAAAQTGRALSATGVYTADHADLSHLTLTNGRFPVAQLAGLRQPLLRAQSALTAALRNLQAIHSVWLLPPLRERLKNAEAQLLKARHDARIGLDATQVLPAFLGMEGERRYFLAIVNPVESRALGDMIGDYAQVSANNGKLHLDTVSGVATLESGGDPAARVLVAPHDYLERYGVFFPNLIWENTGMSPDFPTVGGVITHLYPQSGGVRIDGVISIDPVGLAALLGLIGPVHVAEWPTPITAANVVGIVGHGEYVRYGTDNASRVKFLNHLTRVIWHQLVHSHLAPPRRLVTALRPAVLSGHIMLYSSLPAEEAFFGEVHASWRMPPVRSDYLGVVTQNADGNKIDWYLRRSIDYRATVNETTHVITADVKISLHNLAPSSGDPPIVIDGNCCAVTAPGETKLYLSLYSPWGVLAATVNGQATPVASQLELGRHVYSMFATTPSGATTTVEFHLFGVLSSGALPYSLEQYRQPTLFPDQVSTSVTIAGGS